MPGWLPQLEFYSLIKFFHSVVLKEKDLTVTEGPKIYKVSLLIVSPTVSLHGARYNFQQLCTGAILAMQKAWHAIHAGRTREPPDVCAKA